MQGGGGDHFDFGFPFGGSGDGPPTMKSIFGGDSFDGFGVPNNEPQSQMSNVFGGDSIDGFGRSDGGPQSQMSNVLGYSVDGFGGSNAGPPSLMPDFFGGNDPFDEPFFTQSFGGSMFQPSWFGSSTMDPLPELCPPPLGFTENHHQQPPQARLSGGPIIEEITGLDDDEEGEVYQEKRVILGKRGRSSSEVETEEAIAEERRTTHMQNMHANAVVSNEQWKQQTEERRIRHMHNMHANAMVNSEQWQPQIQERRIRHMHNMHANGNMHTNGMVSSEQWQPQNQGYSFHSSSVTYGGHDGNYYTSSTTRRIGSDGLTFEESKEANTATREAAHRISRGFHNKGHTVERTLNSDGRVGTNQILHNLNEDELAGFEQSWRANAGMQMQLPGLSGSFGSGFVYRENPSMLLPPTDPSSSRARGEPYKRRNATDLSRQGF